MQRPTYTDLSATTRGPIHDTSPNGSSSGIYYYTTVIRRQDWPNDPRCGLYAGRSYRITETWISPDPRYRGQRIASISEPW